MTKRPKVLVMFGTRPEAIKMAPLVAELERGRDIDVVVGVTGQHREMLDQVTHLFGIVPHHDLYIGGPWQSLVDITTAAIRGITSLVRAEKPDAVIVQGDTASALGGALAGFYEKTPVVHLEAGLSSGRMDCPFPEEANRRLISQVATLHLAHSTQARQNLERSGIDPRTIIVTGNTVVDALMWAVAQKFPYADPELADFMSVRSRHVLVTAHRRESWGDPMKRIAVAIACLAQNFPDVGFVLPAHLNPAVREVLLPSLLGLPNVLVTEALPYGEFCRLMAECDVILTDSGGIQEEAPSLGRPVLVMRDTTERPEGVVAGFAEMVGTNDIAIVEATSRLLDHPRKRAPYMWNENPYGDGHAAERATAGIRCMLGIGERLPDFAWEGPVP